MLSGSPHVFVPCIQPRGPLLSISGFVKPTNPVNTPTPLPTLHPCRTSARFITATYSPILYPKLENQEKGHYEHHAAKHIRVACLSMFWEFPGKQGDEADRFAVVHRFTRRTTDDKLCTQLQLGR